MTYCAGQCGGTLIELLDRCHSVLHNKEMKLHIKVNTEDNIRKMAQDLIKVRQHSTYVLVLGSLCTDTQIASCINKLQSMSN